MTKDDILRILMNGATKPKDDLNDYTKGKSSGMAEAYSHAWTLVKKLNIDDVSKCQHPYKKVISGDDGMWCTKCNKYITTF